MQFDQLFAVLFVGVGAFAQSITGIGFSLICAPLLTIALGGGDGVRLSNVLSIFVNLFVLGHEPKGADVGKALLLMIPALVAVPLTAAMLHHANPRILSITAGALVLIAVVALVKGVRIKSLSGRRGAVGAGLVSGAMNVAAGVGGPAVASYAMNANWEPKLIRPTFALMALGLNIFSVAVRGVPVVTLTFVVSMAGALVAGLFLGVLVRSRVSAQAVKNAILVLAALGAVGAMLRT